MFLQIFIQLRINFIFIHLKWQLSTCTVYTLQYIDTVFRQNMNIVMKWKSTVCTLQYMMWIDTIFRRNMKMAIRLTEDGYRTARARGQKSWPKSQDHGSMIVPGPWFYTSTLLEGPNVLSWTHEKNSTCRSMILLEFLRHICRIVESTGPLGYIRFGCHDSTWVLGPF